MSLARARAICLTRPALLGHRLAADNAVSTEAHSVVSLDTRLGESCIAKRGFQVRKLVEMEPVRLRRLETHEVLADRERYGRQPAGLEHPVHLLEYRARVRDHIHRGDGAGL